MSKEIERNCENCYYSKPAIRDDLMYCSYIADTIGDGSDVKLDKHVTETIRFRGFVHEAYVEFGENPPQLKPCVTLKSVCRKFTAKGA